MTKGRWLMLVRPRRRTLPHTAPHTVPVNDDVRPIAEPLGKALHFLRMSGVFYCRSEFTAPFGLALPSMQGCLMFHFVTSGRCWLEVDATQRLLQPGDLALVPHGEGHRLVSERGVLAAPLFELPREQVSDRYEILRHGAGGAPTSVVCGAVRFDHPAAQRLIALLPKMITVEASDSPHIDWIQSTLRFMAAEARQLRPEVKRSRALPTSW